MSGGVTGRHSSAISPCRDGSNTRACHAPKTGRIGCCPSRSREFLSPHQLTSSSLREFRRLARVQKHQFQKDHFSNMSKGGFSVADLQKAQKKLNSVEVAESKTSSSAVPAPQDSKALHSLEELYESHGGDLDLMCVCRGCPRNAVGNEAPSSHPTPSLRSPLDTTVSPRSTPTPPKPRSHTTGRKLRKNLRKSTCKDITPSWKTKKQRQQQRRTTRRPSEGIHQEARPKGGAPILWMQCLRRCRWRGGGVQCTWQARARGHKMATRVPVRRDGAPSRDGVWRCVCSTFVCCC